MRVERDQPDLLQRQAKRVNPRPGHRIIAADQQRQLMRRHDPAHASRIGPVACSIVIPSMADIAMIGHQARQFAPVSIS